MRRRKSEGTWATRLPRRRGQAARVEWRYQALLWADTERGVEVSPSRASEIPNANRPVPLYLGPGPQHSVTNETVSPARNVIVEMTLQPSSTASRHPLLLQYEAFQRCVHSCGARCRLTVVQNSSSLNAAAGSGAIVRVSAKV